jgi:hypothetical protein
MLVLVGFLPKNVHWTIGLETVVKMLLLHRVLVRILHTILHHILLLLLLLNQLVVNYTRIWKRFLLILEEDRL